MTDEEPRSSSIFAGRGFVAATIVVGVLVALGIFVLIATLISPPGGGPTGDPTNGPGPSAGDESVCGLDGFEGTSSLDEAPETDWELVGTIAVPDDPSVGPGVVDSRGLRSCYAHTAQGALYFAVNYVALGSDARTQPFLSELVAPGPGKDAAEEGADSGSPSNTRAQVAGFKVNSYTANEAVIDVAWSVTSASGQLVSFPLVMTWVDGDWRLVLADNGSSPFQPSPLENLGGYIPWAGV